MHQKCLKLDDSWREPLWRTMVVNREKRILMCLVGKCAATTWSRVLLNLTGNPEAIQLATKDHNTLHSNLYRYLTRLHRINASSRHHYFMGHYYKIMFVRDPLERLISGFRDKVIRNDGRYEWIGEKIRRKFRANISTRLTANHTYIL